MYPNKYILAILFITINLYAYDRQAVHEYAKRYALNPNNSSFHYYDKGSKNVDPKLVNATDLSDCANFVSQCLIAGNHLLTPVYFDGFAHDDKNSVFRLDELINILVHYKKATFYRSLPSSIKAGDIAIGQSGLFEFFGEDNATHGMIITSVASNIIKYSGHNNDRFDEIISTAQNAYPGPFMDIDYYCLPTSPVIKYIKIWDASIAESKLTSNDIYYEYYYDDDYKIPPISEYFNNTYNGLDDNKNQNKNNSKKPINVYQTVMIKIIFDSPISNKKNNIQIDLIAHLENLKQDQWIKNITFSKTHNDNDTALLTIDIGYWYNEFKKNGKPVDDEEKRIIFSFKAQDDNSLLDTDGKLDKYIPGNDNSHLLQFAIPKIVLKQSSIYDLHYPQVVAGEDPPSKPILQTIISNVAPPVDWKKVQYLFDSCNGLSVWNKLSCTLDATAKAMKLLCPTFYLGPEILKASVSSSPAAEPFVLEQYDASKYSLDESLKPVYMAIVKTIDTNQKDGLVPTIAPLARSESFREEVKLWLDAKQIVPNSGKGNNRLSTAAKSVDVSKLYDIYLVNDAPDQALVVLPLKRLYESDLANSLPDGSHTLRIETSLKGDEEAEEKEYESSQQLTYVKDFTPGYDDGYESVPAARRIKDDESGFSNLMLNYAIKASSNKAAYINDMALNKIEIPYYKKDEKIDSSDDQTSDDTSSSSDENYKPPKTCTQHTSLSCRRDEIDGCHYKVTCDSTDFAVCLLPFPYVSNPTVNTTWNVFKKGDVSCENNEDYGEMGKFGAIIREGEPVEGQKQEKEEPDDTETAEQGISGEDKSPEEENHPPVVTSIRAVQDDDSPTGVSLLCTWEDEDNDIVPGNTRVFLMPDFDLNKFRELNINKDIEANLVNQTGCTLKNIDDLTEGKFGVKVHIEDEKANVTDDVRLLTVKFDPPKITDVIIDKDNMLVTAIVSDLGSPIDKLNLSFPVVYNFSYLDNHSAMFTVPIPSEKEKNIFKQFLLEVTDLATQTAQKNFYKDIYPPEGNMKHDEDEKKLVTDIYDVDFETGIDISRADLVIDGVVYNNYKVQKNGDAYKIIFDSSYLSEGTHTGYVKACDYNDNCSQTTPETFNVAWPPEIYYFRYHSGSGSSADPARLEAKVWDSGKNLDPDGFELTVDGQPVAEYQYDPDEQMFYYYPQSPFSAGEHTATLVARDTTGLSDSETITFTSAGITNLVLTNKVYRDIEGNGDGVINEGERIYIDLEITNAGDASTKNVWGQLINRSEYIKGVAEKHKRYGFIQTGAAAYNIEPFEFVVNDKVFERDDIDRVEAELLLRLLDTDLWSGKTKTTDIPFTVVIERMDPVNALFEISVVKPAAQTLEPALRLEGSWQTFGTDLNTLDIRITQDSLPAATAGNSAAAFQKDLTVVKNDASRTFYADATLGVGDNRFVVTAAADNGAVRTAEVSVKLLSQVGIELERIAETAEPNVTVTGRAWTENSKLESVEVYVNGGSMGGVIFDADGRFSIPVTLNGGENIIRAVARDDQGKIAADEMTVRMHGPLTLRRQRPNQRTDETPIAACGSYEVEGDGIAAIVTYVNGAPNTYDVTIDRGLKTFCTKADLQPGTNLLRAVGTTTGGISGEAYARIEYTTGGTLSITFDPVTSPDFDNTAVITGSFTLANSDPYNIQIEVEDCEGGTSSYTPTIDPVAHTFTATINLHDTINNDFIPDDAYCEASTPCDHMITATITQSTGNENDTTWIATVDEIEVYGVDYYEGFICAMGYSTGLIEGSFRLNTPGAHIGSIRFHMYLGTGDIWLDVSIFDELSGTWHLDFDVTPYSPSGNFDVEISDTFGNTETCSGVMTGCLVNQGDPIPFNPNKAKNTKRVNQSERRNRRPKRTVDGTNE